MTPDRLEHIMHSYNRAHKEVRSVDDEHDWYMYGHTYIQEMYTFAEAAMNSPLPPPGLPPTAIFMFGAICGASIALMIVGLLMIH